MTCLKWCSQSLWLQALRRSPDLIFPRAWSGPPGNFLFHEVLGPVLEGEGPVVAELAGVVGLGGDLAGIGVSAQEGGVEGGRGWRKGKKRLIKTGAGTSYG